MCFNRFELYLIENELFFFYIQLYCVYLQTKSIMVSISIIIPVYNVEQYIQRCLESVITQTVIGANFECIIVDDCSQDNSMDIVRRMISDYHGPILFKIIEQEKNRGVSVARNTGLSRAIGDYVFFLDSDDYIMPNCFVYFIENLKKYPMSDMIIGNVKTCNGGDLLIHHIQEPWMIDDCNIFESRMLRHQIYLYVWNKLVRRKILIDHNIYFVDGILYEDQLWSYELFSHLSSVLLLPRVTYIYENNPLSIVNMTFTQERADLVIRSFAIGINRMLDNPPVPDHYKRNLTVDYLLFMMNILMSGVDLISRYQVSEATEESFRDVRVKLLSRSVKYGRLLLSIFILLLFPPLYYVQRFHIFRCHYYHIEVCVNKVCHLTDFLHSKKRL